MLDEQWMTDEEEDNHSGTAHDEITWNHYAHQQEVSFDDSILFTFSIIWLHWDDMLVTFCNKSLNIATCHLYMVFSKEKGWMIKFLIG